MTLAQKILAAISLALVFNVSLLAQTYTIQNKTLKEAIQIIALQSKLSYAGDPALLESKKANNIENVEGLEKALEQLLKGTGLEAIVKDHTIIIKAKESVALDAISITATQEEGTAEVGYVSQKISGIGLWDKRSLQDTPYQMSVVSQDLIENSASGIDQIFKMNPVVDVKTTSTSSHSWNTPNINIRGFDASGNQVLDGIPFSWVEGLMTEELERIEILNGLTGFLYGVGYVGGAVNYVTKRPTQERLTNLTIGTTGNEAAYAHVDLGGKIDDEGVILSI